MRKIASEKNSDIQPTNQQTEMESLSTCEIQPFHFLFFDNYLQFYL